MAKSTKQLTDAVPVRMPIPQSRFVMGIAMIILSFAMLPRQLGISSQSSHNPHRNLIRTWNAVQDTLMRVKNRACNDYEHILFVYHLERQIEAVRKSAASPLAGKA